MKAPGAATNLSVPRHHEWRRNRLIRVGIEDQMMISRRKVAGALGLALAGWRTNLVGQKNDLLLAKIDDVADRIQARLGVMVLDHDTGPKFERNADLLFPISSTFKAFAAAALLARVDAGKEQMNRRIRFSADSLVTYSPITELHVGDAGMTLEEICEAACTMSDNTAGNLLLQAMGGPSEFTGFMRSIGDNVTRLDRIETLLNEGAPGDPRDTTSPRAAASSLDKLLLGNVLTEVSRNTLTRWMLGNKVAGPLLRSAIPADWAIADRSGAGGHGSRSIIAAILPPRRKPVVVAIYMTETQASMNDRNAAIAELGKAIVTTIQH
jgi:beta-lactamase class A